MQRGQVEYERKAQAEGPTSNCLTSWPSKVIHQTCGNITGAKIYCRAASLSATHFFTQQICFLTSVCLMTRREGGETKKKKKQEKQKALDRFLIKGELTMSCLIQI